MMSPLDNESILRSLHYAKILNLVLLCIFGLAMLYRGLSSACRGLYKTHERAVEFLFNGHESATYLISSHNQHFSIKSRYLGLKPNDPTFLSTTILQMIPVALSRLLLCLHWFTCKYVITTYDLFDFRQGAVILYNHEEKNYGKWI